MENGEWRMEIQGKGKGYTQATRYTFLDVLQAGSVGSNVTV